jgi:hypothetical protein
MHGQPNLKLLLCAVFNGFTASLSSSCCGGCSSKQKPPWPEFDPSLPLSAKVKNVYSNISTPHYTFSARFIKNMDSFTLSPHPSSFTLPLLNLYFVSHFFVGRDSDWLRAGRSGDRIPVMAKFFAQVQTGTGAHPSSCTMGTGTFPAVKRLGRGADHPPPSSAGVKKG